MGEAVEVAPGIRRITAPNPGPMTHDGTQTYLVGRRRVAVIDPGPDSAAHLTAILAAVGDGEVSHILVTHAHLDHTAGVAALAGATGAPILAYGGPTAGRSVRMTRLAETATIAGGEGVDTGFVPDRSVPDATVIDDGDVRIEAIHTPGHMSNHLCFAVPDAGALISGDHVMGWSSTLISPPDGDLTDFMTSLERVLQRPERHYLPGHGPEIPDGPRAAHALRAHRKMREAQLRDALKTGAAGVPDLTARLYRDIPAHLHPAAARNVLAHLLDLEARGLVRLHGDDPLTDSFHATT